MTVVIAEEEEPLQLRARGPQVHHDPRPLITLSGKRGWWG